MKLKIPLTALAISLVCAAITAEAATALQGQIALRPVTATELKTYGLPATTEKSGGLNTMGVGQLVYLDALVNIAVPATNIVGVTWDLSSKPAGSAATFSASPLGANVPVFPPSAALALRVAGRSALRPDVRGQYTITATITTESYGTTNASFTINAGVWMGADTCALCHSGGAGKAPDMFTSFTNTLHASKFTRGINGQIAGYSKNCISCHVVGYDTDTNAVNGGFDDLAKQLGWNFPTNLTSTNFAAMPKDLRNLANIQCENCHGAGSEHAFSLGDRSRIAKSFDPANCGQCHDATDHHVKNAEWNVSRHAIATTDPSGPGREGCVECHTAIGFAAKTSGLPTTNTMYASISCAGCHDPHDASKPHQLRNVGPVRLLDGTMVTSAGNGALCMNCHHARQNATNYVEVTAGSTRFGPHHGPQGDMFMGVNAITYGKKIPSSAHREVVEEACVTCHMQSVASTSPAYLHAGGHTFNVKWETATNSVELTAACRECHGEIEGFNFARQDFNGDGVIQGVQDEVKGLLNQLSALLPPVGQVKTALSINSSWTKPQLKAGYNWNFVKEDGSYGIHNLPFAVGLLKASIADLTGDANTDGLPDAWQIQYFGSLSNPNAAPGACATTDGVPNWLKYALGLDPMQSGVTVPGGVVWANATTMGGSTNSIQIYNAAEVSFNTEAGKTYQLQGITSLGGTWENIGAPITGTGAAMSYVTPMRKNVQQYFRVITP